MGFKIDGVGDSLGGGANSAASSSGGVAGGAAQGGVLSSGNKILPGLGDTLTSKADLGDFLVGKGVDKLMGLIGGASMGPRVTGLLADMNGRPDPLWQRNWNVIMPVLSGTAPSLDGKTAGKAITMTLPGFYVEEIQMPMIAIETDGVFQQGKRTYFPQHQDIGSVTLNFYVDQDLKALSYIEFWRNQIMDINGVYNYPNTFKHQIKIYAEGDDGVSDGATVKPAKDDTSGITSKVEKSAFGYWILDGCWPSRPNNLSFTGTSDRHVLSVEFSVDQLSFVSLIKAPVPQTLGTRLLGGIKTGLGPGLGSLMPF